MKKLAKISIPAAIVLCLINILCLGYNSIQYLDVARWFEQQEIFSMLIFNGLLVLFFSHFIINLSVVLNLRKGSSNFISGIVLLVIAAVSFMALFFHWGALTDILKEYPMGWEVHNELKAAWFANILHFSFILYALIYLIRLRRLVDAKRHSSGIIGEQLFISLNIIGIVCGSTGLLIVLVDYIFRVNPQSWKWAVIPYSLFVIIPYVLILGGWFFQAISDKQSGWYDEKQRSDIYRSAAFTLFISIPLMLALYIFNLNTIDGMVSILWLPFYLFTVLLIFSVSSLVNFKTA